jgi:hypothetical protein
MAKGNGSALEHSGRLFSEGEVEQIRETVELLPKLSIKELGSTIAQHLGWCSAGGAVKRDACVKLLMKLEAAGKLKLSERQKQRGRPRPPGAIRLTERSEAGPPIDCSLKALGPVQLQVVKGSEEKRLWNEYVERHHPLGCKRPFGYRMRYFIESGRGHLGCLLLDGAAKALGKRDRWIGWSDRARICNLGWLIGNSRFLVFPWVRVKNLASHVLALLARRIVDDWESRWGYRPLLMESFVDPSHFEGSCYKAAGWQYVGMTTGEGLVRPGASYTTTPKMIFLKPLHRDFRTLLCSEDLLELAGRRVD